MHKIFKESSLAERENQFKPMLKQLLLNYQGKKARSLDLRLLQGIKAKHILRFEERKSKIEVDKRR